MDKNRAIKVLLHLAPTVKILALTSFQDDETVQMMLTKGAVGYISKTALARDLLTTIRAIYQGNTVLSSEAARIMLHGTHPQAQHDFKLTSRELTILQAMAEGMNNGEIAAHFLSANRRSNFTLSISCARSGSRRAPRQSS